MDVEAAKRALVGTMTGDSLGLPYEGLAAARNLRLMPFPLRQRMFFGRGFVSDDTLQSVFALQALIECDGNLDCFVRGFAGRLRKWFLSMPPGIGMATVKASLRLCVGVAQSKSGVRSAGNGAAMRSAVLGAAFCDDDAARVRFVEACARVTHTDSSAIQGAHLIALAASLSAKQQGTLFLEQARKTFPDWPWDTPLPERGPSGWVVHSVNAALQIWQRNPDDPKGAIEEAVSMGGDTDTVAAMLGGILGADPRTHWPSEWEKLWGWPQVTDLDRLTLRPSYLRMLAQHLCQLPIILGFGLRRLLPPY